MYKIEKDGIGDFVRFTFFSVNDCTSFVYELSVGKIAAVYSIEVANPYVKVYIKFN